PAGCYPLSLHDALPISLVGAHPLSPERAFAYIQKAVREAKIYTSWHEPKADYEEKLQDFIEGILADEWFQKSLDEFCSPLVHPGDRKSTRLNSSHVKIS